MQQTQQEFRADIPYTKKKKKILKSPSPKTTTSHYYRIYDKILQEKKTPPRPKKACKHQKLEATLWISKNHLKIDGCMLFPVPEEPPLPEELYHTFNNNSQ